MRLGGRGVLVILLLAFGSFAVLDYWNDMQKEKKNLAESKLMTLNFEQVHRLSIDQGESRVVVERDENGWRLTEPLQDIADTDDVEDFIKATVTEQIYEVASEGDVNWEVYGLNSPLGSLTLESTSGEQQQFTVSEKVNFEDRSFLRRNDENRVLVVNSLWQNRVQKTAIDFRQKRLLRANLASVDEIKLKNKEGQIWLAREEGQWKFMDQQDLELDQNEAREFLFDLGGARADEIREDLGQSRGMKELFTVELRMDQENWSAQIVQDKDFKIYAKVSEPKFFMRMEPGALDRFIEIKNTDLEIDQEEDSVESEQDGNNE